MCNRLFAVCMIETRLRDECSMKSMKKTNHSILDTLKFIFFGLFATCKHRWIYFSTPLKLYILQGVQITSNNACKIIQFGTPETCTST